MLCMFILEVSGGTHSLTSTPNDKFFRLFHGKFYLLLELMPEICWEEIAEEIFIFILLMANLGYEPGGFTSNKPTHYLLDRFLFTFFVFFT